MANVRVVWESILNEWIGVLFESWKPSQKVMEPHTQPETKLSARMLSPNPKIGSSPLRPQPANFVVRETKRRKTENSKLLSEKVHNSFYQLLISKLHLLAHLAAKIVVNSIQIFASTQHFHCMAEQESVVSFVSEPIIWIDIPLISVNSTRTEKLPCFPWEFKMLGPNITALQFMEGISNEVILKDMSTTINITTQPGSLFSSNSVKLSVLMEINPIELFLTETHLKTITHIFSLPKRQQVSRPATAASGSDEVQNATPFMTVQIDILFETVLPKALINLYILSETYGMMS